MHSVAALYHFAKVPDPEAVQGPLKALCETLGIKGILLLAPEGINGTIAGPRAGLDAVLAHIRALPGFAELEFKESTAQAMPFKRMKVRLKREIVTMNQPDVDPTCAVGRYVQPENWNAFISEPDVVVIDTRNTYETAIGTFEGAIDPGTRTFGQFPNWWEENAERFHNKKIAMFCTGGIRCEKSTGYLVSQGVEEVYHLKGGVLKYLETVKADESLWRGDCFVFDERVSVGHGLAEGDHSLCRACGRPLNADERNHADFEKGVQCQHCVEEYSDKARARFRQRQQQMELEAKRKSVGAG
ncbi:MAG: rhodanese-related sulfurtransferase [Devosiaceae bacterium]